MKNITLVFAALLVLFTACQAPLGIVDVKAIESQEVITFEGKRYRIPGIKDKNASVLYLVRHAEKELKGKNPALTAEGAQRAERLANILSDARLDAIYSSDYLRTLSTAAPTAKQKDLEIVKYNPRKLDDFVETFYKNEKPQHLLVVGHSNSTPNLLNLFAGKKVYEHIPESDYNRFFIVVTTGAGKIRITELTY